MGTQRRLPLHPVHAKIRTIGTLAVLLATLATIVATSQANAAVKGNAYTGENFDWTIEWDEDVWDFDMEDNSGNSDFFVLTSRDEAKSSLSFLASEDLQGVEPCVNQGAEIILAASGSTEYEQLPDTDAIEIRPGGGAAVFSYEIVGQTSVISTAAYVQCFPLTDDILVRVAVMTDLRPRETTFADVDEVLQTLESSVSSTGDRETSEDRDDSRTQGDDSSEEEDDRRGRFGSDNDDDAGRDDDQPDREDEETGRDSTDDRDRGDDEDESDRDDRDDHDRDRDRDREQSNETGIEGNEYVSPTYGFSFEWDEDVWTVAPDDELINEFPGDAALDRVVLDTETATLFIEGRTDFDDGDMEACVESDISSVESNSEVTDLEVSEDENGDPMEGETSEGAYKIITLTMDDIILSEYIECRPIDEGESVLVITLIAKASDLEDAIPAMEEVAETIEI